MTCSWSDSLAWLIQPIPWEALSEMKPSKRQWPLVAMQRLKNWSSRGKKWLRWATAGMAWIPIVVLADVATLTELGCVAPRCRGVCGLHDSCQGHLQILAKLPKALMNDGAGGLVAGISG